MTSDEQRDNAKWVAGGLQKAIAMGFGPDFEFVLILSHQGKPDSIAVMSSIQDADAMKAVMLGAAKRADETELINERTEH